MNDLGPIARLLMSPHVTRLEDADLQALFSDIQEGVDRLRQRVQEYRKNTHEAKNPARRSAKCHWVCDGERDPTLRTKCQEQCMTPVISMDQIENMEADFPADVKRLRTDPELKRAFLRHQQAVGTIKPQNAEELNQLVEIYSMPIATVALPEESWTEALETLKRAEFLNARQTLVHNWKQRKNDYPKMAMDELLLKIHRNDSEGTWLQLINESDHPSTLS